MDVSSENVALFDMDGTLCDYHGQLLTDLKKLARRGEPEITSFRNLPDYAKERADAIRASIEWWANLPRLNLGWDILEVAQELGYRIMILTQGPRKNAAAWTGKKLWIDENLGEDIDVTITRDKGLVYGKTLIDDWPEYMDRWLRWRRNGLGVMPANAENAGYTHPQVTRYDGTNLAEVREALEQRLVLARSLEDARREGSLLRYRIK